MSIEQLSGFLYEVRHDSLPSKVVDSAELYLESLFGVAAAGSVRPQRGIWRSYFAAGDGQQEATTWDSGPEQLSCEHAAALNTAYAHVTDVDDVHNTSITRLGVVTILAALAVGQKLHHFGHEVLVAVAAGYEISARVGEAINPGSYHYWHTIGVAGAPCFAAVTGRLMGLDRGKLPHAIGPTGTQAAGLWQFLEDGAMSKTLHTANGTLCGLQSARLAALGLIVMEDILAEDRGPLDAMTPDSHPEALMRALSWDNCTLLINSLKPYTCCCYTYTADYCARLLQGGYQLELEYITYIMDHTYQMAANTVDNPEPSALYGCKFSNQYCTAVMLVYGHLGGSAFTPETTSGPRVRRLMDKITLVCDPKLEVGYQADHNRWTYRLEITLEDGRVLTRQVEYPYGDFDNPFIWAYEHGKFHTLADGVLSPDRAAALVGWLPYLEELDDISRLSRRL